MFVPEMFSNLLGRGKGMITFWTCEASIRHNRIADVLDISNKATARLGQRFGHGIYKLVIYLCMVALAGITGLEPDGQSITCSS
jgi:hypothetical protein